MIVFILYFPLSSLPSIVLDQKNTWWAPYRCEHELHKMLHRNCKNTKFCVRCGFNVV